MLYYDPDKNHAKRWAALAALVYLLVLTAVFLLVKCNSAEDKPLVIGGVLISFGTTETTPSSVIPSGGEAGAEGSPVETDSRGEVAVTPPAPARRPDPAALFPGRTPGRTPGSTAASQGATEGAGNAGSPDGSPDGTPGGTGTGDSGIAYDLSGRSVLGTLPKPTYPGNESGRVVVEVTVSAEGRVTYAAARSQGSTTSSSSLRAAAVEAAYKARFSEGESLSQSGTIIYTFRLN